MKLLLMMHLIEFNGDDDFCDRAATADSLPLVSLEPSLDLYQLCASAWSEVWGHPYLGGRHYHLKPKTYLEEFLEETDYDFCTATRVHKSTFHFILLKIENHPVFQSKSHHPQLPVAWQLYVALERLGHDGSGTSLGQLKLLWALEYGTVHLYMSRIITALLSIERDWFWPNNQRRRETAGWIWKEFGFKHCVGFVDGTSLPVHRKPAVHGNIYLNRKSVYSVNAQVVVDDLKRVIHFVVGLPGSVHESLAFCNSALVKRPELCFSPREYLLSDSAYGASVNLVPAYKERQVDDRDDASERAQICEFNNWLARARARNENTIGMLKQRWRCLCGLRVELNEPDDIQRAIKMSQACVVLHNLCLAAGDPWNEEERITDDEAKDNEEQMVQQRGVSPGHRKRKAVQELQACWLSVQ